MFPYYNMLLDLSDDVDSKLTNVEEVAREELIGKGILYSSK